MEALEYTYDLIAYSLMNEGAHYNATQYFTDQFTVYDDVYEYIHKFDIEKYMFSDAAFINLSLVNVVGHSDITSF